MAGKLFSMLTNNLKSLTFRSSTSPACLPTKLTSNHTLSSHRFQIAYMNTSVCDGVDGKHWLIGMEMPEEYMTRKELCDLYIKTLAKAVGSEKEAKRCIYSVFTRRHFGFGALLDPSVVNNIQALAEVRYVIPDAYIDVDKKSYGGEPLEDHDFYNTQRSWVKNSEEPKGRGGISIPDDNEKLKDWDAKKKCKSRGSPIST